MIRSAVVFVCVARSLMVCGHTKGTLYTPSKGNLSALSSQEQMLIRDGPSERKSPRAPSAPWSRSSVNPSFSSFKAKPRPTLPTEPHQLRTRMEISLDDDDLASKVISHDDDDLVAKVTTFDRVLERRFKRLDPPLSKEEQEAVKNELRKCASDPFGDGHQEPIIDPTLVQFQNLLEADKFASEAFVRSATSALRVPHRRGLDILDVLDWNTSSNNKARYWFPALCLVGCIDGVRSAIEQARNLVRAGDPHAVTHLIERRESMARFSALHYCCFGATLQGLPIMMKSFPTDIGAVGKFKEVIEELCRAGARVDAKDIAGYTPLGLVARNAPPHALELLQTLVRLGADPNVKNKFGDPLIMDSVRSGNVAGFRAMLEVWADLSATDTVGKTVQKRADERPAMRMTMELHRVSSLVTRDRCEVCGAKDAKKRCGSCQTAVYCSRTCQVRAWKNGHKRTCGKS